MRQCKVCDSSLRKYPDDTRRNGAYKRGPRRPQPPDPAALRPHPHGPEAALPPGGSGGKKTVRRDWTCRLDAPGVCLKRDRLSAVEFYWYCPHWPVTHTRPPCGVALQQSPTLPRVAARTPVYPLLSTPQGVCSAGARTGVDPAPARARACSTRAAHVFTVVTGFHAPSTRVRGWRSDFKVCDGCHETMPGRKQSKLRAAVDESVSRWCPPLAAAIQRIRREYSVPWPCSCILNFYPDGFSSIASHRHNCWTALLSMGAPRCLSIDRANVLMEDGDLTVFGTHKHGVPLMPHEGGGRISLVMFYRPEADLTTGGSTLTRELGAETSAAHGEGRGGAESIRGGDEGELQLAIAQSRVEAAAGRRGPSEEEEEGQLRSALAQSRREVEAADSAMEEGTAETQRALLESTREQTWERQLAQAAEASLLQPGAPLPAAAVANDASVLGQVPVHPRVLASAARTRHAIGHSGVTLLLR